MKKCQSCEYNNTDIMNFCLECGSALADSPQMVIPLDSLGGQNTEKPSEHITENYEKETVVNNRFPIEQNVPTFQQQLPQQPPKRSNTKLFLAIGGGLFAIVMIIGVAAAGMLIYTLRTQEEMPQRPIVSRTPVEDETPSSTPIKEEDDFPIIDIKPQSTPDVENTPDTSEEAITFPTPTSPTKKGNYTVKTVTGWQLSNVKTVGSQNFRVKSKGKIKLDGIKRRVGAKGVSGHTDRRIIKKFKTGALLMRTHYPDGSHSQIQPVAASQYWVNEPDETGKIEFLINDNSPKANSGSFKVTVTDQGVDKEVQ